MELEGLKPGLSTGRETAAFAAGFDPPADAYVVMTGAALVALLTEAGYIGARHG